MKILKVFFLFIFALTAQQSVGQNLLLLRSNVGDKSFIVRTGKSVKIVTANGQVIKGKILEIRDSSIIIDKATQTEILFPNIHFFSFNNWTGLKMVGVTAFGLLAIVSTTILLANPDQFQTVDLIAPIFLFVGTFYISFHNETFNTQSKYKLTVDKISDK